MSAFVLAAQIIAFEILIPDTHKKKGSRDYCASFLMTINRRKI